MKASWLGVAMLVSISAPAAAAPVYQTDFNSLTTGHTTNPSAAGHDGWYSKLAEGAAFGEIQSTVAFSGSGNALHEATFPENGVGEQTIDVRPISPPDLSLNPIMTLSAHFRAGTADRTSTLPYTAGLAVNGGPHPGFEILGFNLSGGNGVARSTTGVSVSLGFFNGLDNNDPIPLLVGQGLSWDTWYSLTLVANQSADRYVSLTVDGFAQDISAFALPRSDVDGTWTRGALMEQVIAQVISSRPSPPDPPVDPPVPGAEDHVYWDNLSVDASPVPEPTTFLLWGTSALGIAGLRRWRRRSQDQGSRGRPPLDLPA